jgi:hypothetical protein
MALYRTALRLAALESLRPTAMLNSQGPWPTLAADRVFDSRLDPIEDLTRDQHKACIVVYTEGDLGYAGQRRGGPPFRREVDLIFEISQIAAAPSDANPAVYVAGVPQTDAELEAELDRIESEIYFALMWATNGVTVPFGSNRTTLFRALTGRMVTDPRSMPHRTSEEGVRLAMRTVTWKVQTPDDDFEGAPVEALLGLDRLPEPLKKVVKALATTAYGKQIGLALGETMPTMPVAIPLLDVTLGVEVVTPGETAVGTANINGDVPLTGYPPKPPGPPPTDSNP